MDRNFRLNCLYTKHMQKKRKTWLDGCVHIIIDKNNSSGFCKLYSASGREAVESRQLEKHEVMNIVSKTECTIEMENHIVNIEFTSNVSSDTTSTVNEPKKLVLPKFKPPATVVKRVEPSLDPSQLEKIQRPSTNLIVKGSYSVARDELDDIWGRNDSEKESDSEDDNYDGIGNRSLTVPDKRVTPDRLPHHSHQQRLPFPSSSSRIVHTDQDIVDSSGFKRSVSPITDRSQHIQLQSHFKRRKTIDDDHEELPTSRIVEDCNLSRESLSMYPRAPSSSFPSSLLSSTAPPPAKFAGFDSSIWDD